MISTSHLNVNLFWFSQCCIGGTFCEQLENPELWAAYLKTHKLRSFAMNLIKVLLGNLASTQQYAMSQGDYSYPAFEPLPNHVKNYRDMWNSAFPVAPRSVNKLLYSWPWWAAGPRRGHKHHADDISESFRMSTQLNRWGIPSMLSVRQSAPQYWCSS